MAVALDDLRLQALEQAWEAFRHGSFPVGAVVADPSGAVVALGRNRMREHDAPSGRLRNTLIAHAEIDAIGQLAPGEYADHLLVTTLEPCLLCRSAMVLSHIGNVHMMAADCLWQGLELLPSLNAQVQRRHPKITGPDYEVYGWSDAAFFASVLPLAAMFTQGTSGYVAEFYSEHDPVHVAAAKYIVQTGHFPSRRLSVIEAIDHVCDVTAHIRNQHEQNVS